jgi:hypothetical protein
MACDECKEVPAWFTSHISVLVIKFIKASISDKPVM